jgi:hypothetical protein
VRHLSAERRGHRHEAVADAEDRRPRLQQLRVQLRGAGTNTDCGPPDSTIAFGFLASICSTGMVCGTSSE